MNRLQILIIAVVISLCSNEMILKCDSELKCHIAFKNYIENQQKIICFHPFKKDTKQIMPGFGAIYKPGENNIKVEYFWINYLADRHRREMHKKQI